MIMPLEVEVKRWIQTHLAHTRSYICPVQKYGAFSYMFFTPNSLVCIAAALSPSSVAVHSHGPVRPFSWTLLNLKTVKETEHFLNRNEWMTRSAHHLTGTKGQLSESIGSLLELLGQWRIQAPSCLPLPSRGCKSAMECLGKVQWTLLLWFLHSQWSKFELKREYRMLFCALIFMNIQSFFFFFSTSTYILPFHVFTSAACHITVSCLTGGHNLVLHIEITELGQNFLYAVVDEETHCWRTSAIKCTLYVQRLFNTGDHTADLDISHFYII